MKNSKTFFRGLLNSRWRLLLVGVALVINLAGPTQASIIITSNFMEVKAFDPSFSVVSHVFNGTTINNTSTPIDVNAISGNAYSKNMVDFWTDGLQTTLSVDMDHQRTGATNSYGYTYDNSVYFTANDTEAYQLSGFYNVTDVGNTSGYVQLTALLYDLSTDSYVFSGHSVSQDSSNESFSLGVAGGDFDNQVIGSLTGNLVAGNQYQFRIFGFIQAWPDGDNGASAVGNVTLKIGTPEPATLFVWSGLGLVAAGVTRRRR